MKTKNSHANPYLDVLFTNKYKEYGAYELRLNYEKRVKKAMAFLLLGITIFSTSIIATARFSTEDMVTIKSDKIDKSVIVRQFHVLPPAPKLKEQKGVASTTPKPKLPSIAPPKINTKNIVISKNNTSTPIVPKPKDPIADAILPPKDNGAVASNTPTNNLPQGNPKGDDTKTLKPTGGGEVKITDIKTVADLDIEPSFPGGEDTLLAFLEANLVYPEKAKINGTAGKVEVEFVVDELGNISTVKLGNKIGDGCDQEAIRVVKMMPKWNAGRYQGKAVKSYFSVPIVFEIER